MRGAKHGFWDEELRVRIDEIPFPSAEDEFFAEPVYTEPTCDHNDLYQALQCLTSRQAFVIRLHYGIECEAMTIQEIADFMTWHHSTVQEHLELGEKSLEKLLIPRENTTSRDSTS